MRVTWVASALGVLGLLVSGCARYHDEPLSADANAIALERRTLDDPRLQKFVAASLTQEQAAARGANWDLTTLGLAAIYYHPNLDITRAGLALARARVVTAGQRPNPSLDFALMIDSAASPGAIPPGALPATIGPVINFVIETFGKREYRTAEARLLARSARWGLAAAGWEVRAGVRSALSELWAAQRRTVLARERLDLQDRLVRLFERRLQLGEANGLDVARERIDRAQAALALRGFEWAAGAARVRLAAAIGIPSDALAGVVLSFAAFDHAGSPPGEQFAEGALRRRALTGRSDVRAALAQYEAAQMGLRLAVANQYPSMTLGAGYTYDAGTNKYSLSPALELPIFNQNQGPIAEARVKRQQAAAAVTALQARIIAAIDAAVAADGAAQRELATADALLADAQHRESRVAASFRAGELDRPSLLSAELETVALRLSRLDTLVAQLQALGALEDALQYPLFEPTALFSLPPTGEPPQSEPAS